MPYIQIPESTYTRADSERPWIGVNTPRGRHPLINAEIAYDVLRKNDPDVHPYLVAKDLAAVFLGGCGETAVIRQITGVDNARGYNADHVKTAAMNLWPGITQETLERLTGYVHAEWVNLTQVAPGTVTASCQYRQHPPLGGTSRFSSWVQAAAYAAGHGIDPVEQAASLAGWVFELIENVDVEFVTFPSEDSVELALIDSCENDNPVTIEPLVRALYPGITSTLTVAKIAAYAALHSRLWLDRAALSAAAENGDGEVIDSGGEIHVDPVNASPSPPPAATGWLDDIRTIFKTLTKPYDVHTYSPGIPPVNATEIIIKLLDIGAIQIKDREMVIEGPSEPPAPSMWLGAKLQPVKVGKNPYLPTVDGLASSFGHTIFGTTQIGIQESLAAKGLFAGPMFEHNNDSDEA